MQKAVDAIEKLARETFGQTLKDIALLPQSGSDRRYFRVFTTGKSYIGAYNANIRETEVFIYFSDHFRGQGLPVPEIIACNEDRNAYLQTDFGPVSLLNKLEEHGYTDYVKSLFAVSLKQLAHLQVKGDAGLDYSRCLTAREFGKQAILSDLLYFKYYFLDTLREPYDKQALLDDFDALATYLTHTEYKFFMFRDFQSRNIMIQDDQPYFIDYQGGMKGAPQYDAASMIWQARADLPDDWKQYLLTHYMDCLDEVLDAKLDRYVFVGQYYGYVLIRLLQVLGAYGFRGLFERKAQFLTSIPLALRNMQWFMTNRPLGIHVPEFKRLLAFVTSEELINRFDPPKANEDTALEVRVQSFSYLKNGYPEDETGTGGGFVFDCRGILNPGRFDEYKKLSGLDKDVADFLEQQTRMPEFLNSVFDMIDINVEDYMKRGFSHLTISFGCTGGQHRSVYAAEQTNRHLRNKYRVRTQLVHLNKENWVK